MNNLYKIFIKFSKTFRLVTAMRMQWPINTSVLRRPPAHTLDAHEYALAWYDLHPQDFVHEGRGDVEIGKL